MQTTDLFGPTALPSRRSPRSVSGSGRVSELGHRGVSNVIPGSQPVCGEGGTDAARAAAVRGGEGPGAKTPSRPRRSPEYIENAAPLRKKSRAVNVLRDSETHPGQRGSGRPRRVQPAGLHVAGRVGESPPALLHGAEKRRATSLVPYRFHGQTYLVQFRPSIPHGRGLGEVASGARPVRDRPWRRISGSRTTCNTCGIPTSGLVKRRSRTSSSHTRTNRNARGRSSRARGRGRWGRGRRGPRQRRPRWRRRLESGCQPDRREPRYRRERSDARDARPCAKPPRMSFTSSATQNGPSAELTPISAWRCGVWAWRPFAAPGSGADQ